jgi:hypothetical protein
VSSSAPLQERIADSWRFEAVISNGLKGTITHDYGRTENVTLSRRSDVGTGDRTPRRQDFRQSRVGRRVVLEMPCGGCDDASRN